MGSAVGGITGQDPKVYEEEYVFWPWAKLIDATIRWIETNARPGATVLDYMCGTGFLLNRVHGSRPDLECFGCDLDLAFIAYGRERYTGINLVAGSALDYVPSCVPDIIVCTGGLHHLPRERRAEFLSKCADEVSPAGAILIGEEVIADHDRSSSRRLAVLELYHAILDCIIAGDAPSEVLSSAVTAMHKEFLEQETSKDSKAALVRILSESLAIESLDQTWPQEPATYGDHFLVCRTCSAGGRAR